MPSEHKSPLHRRALTRKELTPEREIVYFNIHLGILGEYCVVSVPEERERSDNTVVVVLLKDLRTGGIVEHRLDNLGALPYSSGTWNEVNFIIDRRFISELPSELVPKSPRLIGLDTGQLRGQLHRRHPH